MRLVFRPVQLGAVFFISPAKGSQRRVSFYDLLRQPAEEVGASEIAGNHADRAFREQIRKLIRKVVWNSRPTIQRLRRAREPAPLLVDLFRLGDRCIALGDLVEENAFRQFRLFQPSKLPVIEHWQLHVGLTASQPNLTEADVPERNQNTIFVNKFNRCIPSCFLWRDGNGK